MITTIVIGVLALIQFALSLMYFWRLFRGFAEGKTSFAGNTFDRIEKPGGYWGLMAFYCVCIFATLLIGVLLYSLLP